MINVTKQEAMAVRQHYPDACIIRTRHKWHMEENDWYLMLIPHNQQAAEILKDRQARRARRRRRDQAVKAAGQGV